MKKNWLVAGALGAVSAIVYFASMADYAFPGVSAQLQALWLGLDTVAQPPYPLMAVFAKMFGVGNALAPVCGAAAVVSLFALTVVFVGSRAHGEQSAARRGELSLVAGLVAAVVFMFTPAVREASSHLEPRMFDFCWALLSLLLAALMIYSPRSIVLLLPAAMGVTVALGACDSALFFAMVPVFVFAITAAQRIRGVRPYLAVVLFAFAGIVSFPVAASCFGLEFSELLRGLFKEFKAYYTTPGWLFVAIFATLPFVTSIFSSEKAYNEKPAMVQWFFHASMTFISILAIATPLSPSSQMETYGVLPVATSAFAAFTAGHLVSYWWLHRRSVIAIAAGGLFVFVLSVTCIWNLFVFERDRGAFADKVAEKVLSEMDGRKWIVTDGVLDDHLRLAAARKGQELNIVSLSRDLDTKYLEELGKVVKAKGIGGSKNESLALSLTLGVLPFVQDWFAADPSVTKEAVIYGAPDLWYSAGLKPVPEFIFFGADEKRVPDWNAWKEFDALLEVPAGWGSYKSRRADNPVTRMRHSIRRHLGLVANDRGVYLQDQKKDDEAFAMYELVLDEIDSDNISALFNEIGMAGAKHPKALAKRNELERVLKAVVDDKNRRYHIWRLGNYYGYIRNPDMFVRLGYAWARSGRPGDALVQIKRAIDFIPTDKRAVLMNMMAALYANENDHIQSRRIYQSILEKNGSDHDALIGMMRLELMGGDSAKALSYLEKAAAVSGKGKRADMEMAMAAMMKNDLAGAKERLRKVTDADIADLQAWSLLAAVVMQQCDAAKDEKSKAAFEKELADTILPTMEKQARGPFDYYVQTTKAFLLLRQGESKRREARDAFVAAARSRPDIAVTQDMVLGLDISLDDGVSAERHAREALRRNRNAPLANYVMGSLALRKNEYREAEAFLRKAADAPKPVPLALNDLAEVLRRNKNFTDAEHYARKAVETSPKLYVAWETLGSILMDAKKGDKGALSEAEKCILKACELSRDEKGREADVRMLVALARVQAMRGDRSRARGTIRKVQARIGELSDFEKREFEELKKSVR
ncbi:MAG: tetratricopeptide repeat protein [Kiritimatiellae bacterium]|nr:tetratricopeptide repeat protein [Kiritimatiellia bacterium]